MGEKKQPPTAGGNAYPFSTMAENAGNVRHVSPSAARNTGPILAVLESRLPEAGLVLEVASGTGEHAVALGKRFPHLTFQPSDPDPDARASILGWREDSGLDNVLPPLDLDMARPAWAGQVTQRPTAMLAVNMVHISPWEATLGLLQGAAKLLPAGGGLFIYGPFQREGRHTAPSNAQFHQSLVDRNPAWGVRDVNEVSHAAKARGLEMREAIEMPANNLILHFQAG